jgi:hypothetical protein
VLRFHGRTDKRVQSLVEKALREKKHPALSYETPPAAQVDDEADEAPPAPPAQPVQNTEPGAPPTHIATTNTPVRHGRGGPPKLITVRGRSLTRAEWATELGVSEAAIYFAVQKNGRTWEEEIERRLALRDDTGAAKAPGLTRGKQERERETKRPAVSPRTSDADGALDDLREILRVAAEHGGLRELLVNAELGRKVRTLTEEARA